MVVKPDNTLDFAVMETIIKQLRVMGRCSPKDKYHLVQGLRHFGQVCVCVFGCFACLFISVLVVSISFVNEDKACYLSFVWIRSSYHNFFFSLLRLWR